MSCGFDLVNVLFAHHILIKFGNSLYYSRTRDLIFLFINSICQVTHEKYSTLVEDSAHSLLRLYDC